MPLWLSQALVLVVGGAHVIAAWVYFAREDRIWVWPSAWAGLTLATLVVAPSAPTMLYGAFSAAVVGWTAWWLLLQPAVDRNWVPENRHQSTATLIGDTLTIHNLRNFEWTSKRDFVERWETRTFDLSQLTALDMFVHTWGDARIAHTMVSFDFAAGPPLCISIETRREVGEKWTPFAGFMRSYELLILACDERDAIRYRSVVRGEDVRLYRVYATPQMRRAILERYVSQMNRVAVSPKFYNTIFTNCTTEVARIVWSAGHSFPLDWRLLASGYLADYMYDQKLLATDRSLDDLKRNADIRARAAAAKDDPEFSRRIRDGLADPMAPRDETAAGPAA
jgi:hypothetical protein